MAARDSVGRELARLRRANGITGVQLARALSCTQSYISKLESGKLMPSLEFVSKFAKHLRLEKTVSDRLLAMTNDFLITYSRWSAENAGNLHSYQESVEEQENDASHIHSFNLTVIPGLLQVRNYAEAIFVRYLSLLGVEISKDELAKAVNARVKRQKILENREKHVILVISELALANPFPTPSIHNEQLRHLQAVLEGGVADVRIVPSTALLSPPPLSSFEIYDGAHVNTEGPISQQRLWDPREVRAYQELFKNLMLASVTGKSAIQIVRQYFS